MPASDRVSAVVVRVARADGGEALAYLRASEVEGFERAPLPSRVVGATWPVLGVATVLGAVVPLVVAGADARGRADTVLLCTHEGSSIGILGASVLKIGVFPRHPEDPRDLAVDGERVPRLDVAGLAACVRARPWAGRVRT